MKKKNLKKKLMKKKLHSQARDINLNLSNRKTYDNHNLLYTKPTNNLSSYYFIEEDSRYYFL